MVFSTACESECDFDTLDDLCGWTVHNDDPDLFGFGQWAGPTDTEGTGPEDDFSKPGCKENTVWFLVTALQKAGVVHLWNHISLKSIFLICIKINVG